MRWTMTPWNESEEEQAQSLVRQLGLPPLVAKLLVRRGCGDIGAANRFLYGGIDEMHDPFLLKGMKEAVEAIREAGDKGEKIRIYGDYDADGVSSTSLLIMLFRKLGYHYDYYIPHRALEGYGLNRKALELASQEGVSLIVTVDTGISAHEEAAYAMELGMKVVVTDHHEPPERIPEGCPVVNPKRHDCPYPFKGLAGAGVAFKLAHAMLGEPPLEWADIATLGTIADLMPLEDENRILVREGLKRMKQADKPGFRALAEVCGTPLADMTSTAVAFGIAPRINAAGRLDHAGRAVELLTSASYDEAILSASALDLLNKERQRTVEAIVKDAERQWASKCAEAEQRGEAAPPVIVLAGEDWNVGVIGIVASKLLERHYRPTVIFGIDPATGMAKGSARSIDGFDLHAALTECESLLDHYGGHQAAAGMSLHRDRLPELERRLGELALSWLTDEDWIPTTGVDLICGLEEASLQTIEQLSLLEPFGVGNPSPKVLIKGAKLADWRAIGKEAKHLKLALRGRSGSLDAIGFGFGETAAALSGQSALDLIGELSVNEWNGVRKPQLQIHDMKSSAATVAFPEREQFAELYKQLRKLRRMPAEGTAERLGKLLGWPADTVGFMLAVFMELEFIRVDADSRDLIVVDAPAKRELGTSRKYREAKLQSEQASLAASADLNQAL